MSLEECLHIIEDNGYEWLVRSVSPWNDVIKGRYFAHIHGMSKDPDGDYVESYKATSNLSMQDAIFAAYEEMLGSAK